MRISRFVEPRFCTLASLAVWTAVGLVATGTAGAQSVKTPKGLHIPKGRNVGFNYQRNDGGGYRWDIQYYGSIGSGTNHVYSSGLYCQINGSNFRGHRGQGWSNKAGDEIEVGPYNRNGLTVHRRVKVYTDRPLARWLDIFENPSGQPITVNVRVYSYINYGIASTTTSTGDASFGEKDWAFITETRGNHAPSLLHIVCGERSKLRPRVSVQGNQVYVNYSFTVPAKKAAVLCYFEAQNRSSADLRKQMEDFRLHKALRDLPAAVRRLIVNFPPGYGLGEIDLDRSDKHDTVIVDNGDPMLGEIVNEFFEMETLFGTVRLPAGDIVGMAAIPMMKGRMRALLTDGQILSGETGSQALTIRLSTGGEQEVPLSRIRQWSYRIAEARPEEVPFKAPLAVLRTGDRLRFAAEDVPLSFRTRYGAFQVKAEELAEIRLDNEGNGVHRAMFLTGSRIGGILEPSEVSLKLTVRPSPDADETPTLTIPTNLISRLVYASEDKPDPTLTEMELNNEDRLLGRLTEKALTFEGDFGTTDFEPTTVQAVLYHPEIPGRAALKTWAGTILRGRLKHEALAFALTESTVLRVHADHIIRMVRSQAMPPEDVRAKVERLIAQLGAETYQDRQSAMDALKEMGDAIQPLLENALDSDDPEVRQRIEELLNGIRKTPETESRPDPGAIFFGAQRAG